MARLRLGYTKSRGGCLRCKQRRVKCDETRPSCRACVRHGIECSLSTQPNPESPAQSPAAAGTPSPSSAPTPQPAPSRKSRARPINPKPVPEQQPQQPLPQQPQQQLPQQQQLPLLPPPPPGPLPQHASDAVVPSPAASALASANSPSASASPDPFPYLAKFVTGPPEEDTANWVLDLEVLHHFTTSTYSTFMLDTRSEINRLWQMEVPRQAFAHIFLLHLILAVGSYHLAYLHPENRQTCVVRASQHLNAGIRRMRVALSDLSAANCHALFASSSLLFIGSLAALSVNRPNEGPTVDDLVDVLILVKGIGSVLDSAQDLLRTGPLSELFIRRGGTGECNLALERVVLAVSDLLVEIAEIEPDARVRAMIHAETYRMMTVIRAAISTSPVAEYRVVAAWPIQMSDELIPLLRQRNQAALALLSYYCVVFHAAELQGYWFMQGWSAGVIRDISRTTEGPWKRHSAWALGWITGHATMG